MGVQSSAVAPSRVKRNAIQKNGFNDFKNLYIGNHLEKINQTGWPSTVASQSIETKI